MQTLLVALFSAFFYFAAHGQSFGQPTQEPGEGQPFQFGEVSVEPRAKSIVVDDLARNGRVRGLRLIARGGGVIITRVVVRYTNGQVHFEDREIILGDGEQTRIIDPRFEERLIRRVDVTLKDGRRADGVFLEVWGIQSPAAVAEKRPQGGKKRSARPSSGTRSPTVSASKERPPEPVGSGAPADRGLAPESTEAFTSYAVYFGTDRQTEADRTMTDGRVLMSFGGEPASDRQLKLGRAVVTVPKSHITGAIERPEIALIVRQIPYGEEDRRKHFTLMRVDTLQAGAFGSSIAEHLARARAFVGQAFVFIHGFNVTFDDALFRAAQISHDMRFDGLPLVYSWPSAGRAEAYQLDRERAVDSSENLQRFLRLVAEKSGAKEIHLIAHSTGAFVLMQALKALESNRLPAGSAKLGQMVFAAPDILADNFKVDARRLQGLGKGMTLYASSGDWALWLSGLVKTGRNPAGALSRGGIPLLVGGVDSIDVSNLDTSYFSLNHSTFGDHDTLIRDMGTLMATGTRPPNQRDQKFKERNDPASGGKFWRYEAR